jgi:glycosyltransferase involved in cell wall biosynthesis
VDIVVERCERWDLLMKRSGRPQSGVVDVVDTKPQCVLAMYGAASEDPPTRQTVSILLERGFGVSVIQLATGRVTLSTLPSAAVTFEVAGPQKLGKFRPVHNFFRWWRFRSMLRRQITRLRPQVVITIMLHPLAAMPRPSCGRFGKLVSCIYDIPNADLAGKLDSRIIRKGWKRLKEAEVVWASDVYKAQLAMAAGGLAGMPLVCHNCPPQNYLTTAAWPRDPWLRQELRGLGATIGGDGGCILLRAGAIGEFGGIEETLAGMKNLSEDYVFLMMGRPPVKYKEQLLSLIAKLDLGRRAFLWDQPSEDCWKKALQGADVGHLIHGPFPSGPMTRLFELNSSLSNNRLFQYMSAGLPIISYDDPRMDEIYDEVRCFRVVRLSDLQDGIRSAWSELGGDPAQRRALGDAGRSAHLEKYCWEVQFKPVLNAIVANDARADGQQK